MGKGDTSPSFGSLRFLKLQIFVEMFCANLQSPVWSRHVGGALCFTNMTVKNSANIWNLL